MWEVSVPSWDEPSSSGGADSAKAGGKKGRRKSGGAESAGATSASGDVFKVVTASLQGEAVAEVKRAIDEASSRRKRRRSSQMEVEAASPAPVTPQGAHSPSRFTFTFAIKSQVRD
jgi:hypothetical protein